ncbi:thymidine phosphorylase-like [Haliotis rubra]|uniref:thymidine phosphorylase-like n=1 Tax=Haliotis rubra TaxID=36100 RepID=UPI001EE60FFE|nr:thymidine phosphorylase-like [Haliotis rubra]XP_046559401.1 thymidine phosphorylase-like [Haliotis rubra]XP_046559402.1 thymidine phosphorylase-like [Haliotis rubra]
MSSVSFPALITKKRNKEELSRDEIEAFVNGIANNSVQDSQIGAMLMAMYLNDLTMRETTDLTRAMMNSGDTLSWPEEWKGNLVDKHSTGGVGDKVSLILAPALAACGVKVPMISGRGLEHTGGTLDKLESIPGFQVSVTSEKMLDIIETVGCCIVGQTKKLCPADSKMYAIRDVTATVDNLGLITGSIISKKAAEKIDALVLDVKFGNGAFLKDIDTARKLARMMVGSGNGLGINTVSLLTSMNSPLGKMVGNALEVAETVWTLQGNGPDDLLNLVIELGGELLSVAGKAPSSEEGRRMVKDTISDGTALARFCHMAKAQGVDPAKADALCAPDTDVFSVLPRAGAIKELLSRNRLCDRY